MNEERLNSLTQSQLDEIETYQRIRNMLKNDKLRPKYHFTSPLERLNDPNGFCFYHGNWHLFYQFCIGGIYHWGHAYSEDSLHWKDLPIALKPGEFERQCWSGSVMIEGDRAIAAYYSLDRGIVIAVSEDPLLMDWKKRKDGRAVIETPSTPELKATYSVFDPFLWKKDGTYYIISGKFHIDPVSGKRERQEYLFCSEDLDHWTYLHEFIENDRFAEHGDDGACPYFVPLEDRYVLFHFSHMGGPKCIVGDYDRERDHFVASDGYSLTTTSSFFGGLHAPSVYPEGDKSVRAIFNVNDCKQTETLNQVMSLPRSVSFADCDHNELAFRPIDETVSLRDGEPVVTLENVKLEANNEYVIENLEAGSAELNFTFEEKNIPAIEIRVFRSMDCAEYTSIAIYRQRGNTNRKHFRADFGYKHSHDSVLTVDTLHSSLDTNATLRAPEMQAAYISPDEKLHVRVFTDQSIVEVFVNDLICCTARVYPTKEDSVGVSVNAIGGEIVMEKFSCYRMKEIF